MRHDGTVGYTVVSFHAHPDDEALFTAGTLARAAAEGHRVILVVATAGEAGLAATSFVGDQGLAARRTAELEHSAAALGCRRCTCSATTILVSTGERDDRAGHLPT